MTHYAPLFALVLSGMHVFGLDAIGAARLVNALMFGANVLLVGLAVGEVTSSVGLSLLGALVTLTSPIMIEVHSWTMSEPLYLFLGLMGLYLLSCYQKRRRRGLLIASAVSIGLAFLTRYVGGSVVASAVAAVLLESGVGRREKVRDALLFLLFSLPPMGAWMIRNLVLTGGLTSRQLAWHPIAVSLLKRPLALVWEWLLPWEFSRPALLVTCAFVGLLLVGGLVFFFGQLRKRDAQSVCPPTPLSRLHSIYIAVYAVSIVLTICLFDAATEINNRIAAPVYVSLVVVLLAAVSCFMRSRWAGRVAKIGVYLLALTLVTSYVHRSVRLVQELAVIPRGFGELMLQQEGGLEEVRAIPAQTVIYTNNLEALYIIYNRGGYLVPETFDPITLEPRSDFDQWSERTTTAVESGRAILVFFSPDHGEIDPWLTPGLTELVARNGVVIVGQVSQIVPRE
ncbi:MAG: glycosyltransferase family 39 protein [Anaerolineales bacterium]|nr:glycosyltransferase family 39 protein [Anaerolineales bacterium]